MNEDDIKLELPRSCACPAGKCQPEKNEGCFCWRSGCYIPRGYFSGPSVDAVSPSSQATSSTETT